MRKVVASGERPFKTQSSRSNGGVVTLISWANSLGGLSGQASWRRTSPPDKPNTVNAEPASAEPGNMWFGVLFFSVRTLDWVQLSRQDNRRAALDYEVNGACSAMRWLTP